MLRGTVGRCARQSGVIEVIRILAAVVLIAGLPVSMAHASDGPPESAIVQFDIPAQALTEALIQFGRQAGIQASVDAALAQGLRSRVVKGPMSWRLALVTMLQGTGLDYRVDGSLVTLVPVSEQAGPIQLDAIVVQGWRTTELQGFRPQRISSALKTDEAIADTPASVSVVTEDVIRAQGARSVGDALRNVPGVTPGPNPGNVSVQEEVNIRGFQNEKVSVNGVERNSSGPLSLANVESVEVLKGPFSILYGDLSPGGFINVQTKRPQREFSAEIVGGLDQVTDGRGTLGNGSIDITGPLNEDGTFLFRLIASADGGTSFIEEVESERYLVAPSLSYIGLDGDLRVDFDYTYLENDETFEYGIPAFDGEPDTRIPFDTFLGSENNEKSTKDHTAELRADLQMTDATSIDAALTWHDYDHLTFALRPGDQSTDDGDEIFRNLNVRDLQSTDLQFESNLTHEIEFEETNWRFLVGGDIRRTTLDIRNRQTNNFDTTNVFNPDTKVPFPPLGDVGPGFEADNTTIAWGMYGQAEVWIFDRLKLLGGFRYDDIEFERQRPGLPDADVTRSDTNVSPRAAALYKATPTTSVYGSYSTSFQQTVAFNPADPPFDPTEGKQFEIGLKQEFFDGSALFTVALFDLTQENLVQPDPVDSTRSVQIGEAKTRGLEIEISGEVVEGFRVIGGYTFLDTEVSEATDGTEGNRLTLIPEHAASLFATYAIFDRGDERLTVGGGVFYTGARFTETSNTVELPDFVTVDLMGEYAFTAGDKDLRARVGLKNVFDEEYFVSGFGNGIAYRGQPRTLSLELGVEF